MIYDIGEEYTTPIQFGVVSFLYCNFIYGKEGTTPKSSRHPEIRSTLELCCLFSYNVPGSPHLPKTHIEPVPGYKFPRTSSSCRGPLH